MPIIARAVKTRRSRSNKKALRAVARRAEEQSVLGDAAHQPNPSEEFRRCADVRMLRHPGASTCPLGNLLLRDQSPPLLSRPSRRGIAFAPKSVLNSVGEFIVVLDYDIVVPAEFVRE